jgi:hypothetical protein
MTIINILKPYTLKEYNLTDYQYRQNIDYLLQDIPTLIITHISKTELLQLMIEEGDKTDYKTRRSIAVFKNKKCILDWSFEWKNR